MQRASLRAGIIGTGGIAASHLEGYRANGIEVAAVADVDRSRCEAFAARHNVGRVYFSGAELVDAAAVDLVSICTPPAFHKSDSVAALGAGIHVLCEKPLAHTEKAARAIAAAADAVATNGVRFATAFRHRFLPAVRRIKELIDAGKVGRPLQYTNHFAAYMPQMADSWFSDPAIAGGGSLVDTTVHSIDIFRFLFGEAEVCGCTTATALPSLAVEDTSMLLLQSPEGVMGVLLACWVSGDDFAYIDLVGADGRIRFDYANGGTVRVKARGAEEWLEHQVSESNGFAEQIAAFLASITGETEPECGAHAGLRANEILSRAYEFASAAVGRTV